MALPGPSNCIGSIRLLADGALVDTNGPAWQRFTQSWDDLPLDTHMADGGTYRHRRYAAFRLAGTDLERLPHCAHFQERDHNPLNGGSPRWFATMLPAVADGDTLRAIIRGTAARLEPVPGWRVEVHQFRIHADATRPGLPTPEGMHRDGRHHVLIMLTGLSNVRGGTTSIVDNAGCDLTRHRLTRPGEALLLDDGSVRHATSPIHAIAPELPAWRDTLVVTFAR